VGLVSLGGLTPEPISAQSATGSDLRVISAGDRELVLELTVADFQVATIEHAGQIYHQVSIPNTAQRNQPGAPRVPTQGTMIGIPTPENVSVEIIDSDLEVLTGLRLYPAPILNGAGEDLTDPDQARLVESFAPDPTIYAANAFYPANLVDLGETGYMRDQAVAQVQFYPVQYNPVTGEVRLYRRLVARVSWSDAGTSATAAGRLASPGYENLLKATLLNYAELNRPDPVEVAPGSSSDSIGVLDTTPRLKIEVTEDAIYRLAPADLTGAGFALSGVDSRTLKISNRGTQIPIFVFDGNNNNSFDGNDYVLFYGTALSDMYTTANVYWLEAGGGFGARMSSRGGSGTTNPTSFPATLHAEQDTYYWSGKGSGGLAEDHWFWGNRITAPNSGSFDFYLNNIASSNATLRVRMKGRTSGSHRTEVYLNGSLVNTQSWSGQVVRDQSGSVSNLRNGTNTVTVKPTVSGEQINVNWIEIDYSDTYVAENNALFMRAPSAGSYRFGVSNFASNDIRVFDISDPNNVAIMSNATVSTAGGKFTVTFRDSATTNTRYLATANYPLPEGMQMDQASDWRNSGNRADYVIITHEDFLSAASNLATHRRNSGLKVALVNVEDVYDEFNHGIFNPSAIRDFLAHSLSWNKAPTYVLLLGGATFDYRDLLGFSRRNYVPTQIIELGSDDPRQDQTISDNWFVAVSGADVLPDMLIGRLAAQSGSEATEMVNKIIAYDQNPPAAPWNRHALLVADKDDNNPFNTITYEATSNSLASRLPDGYAANKVYQTQIPDPTSAIVDDLNNGSVLVNYAGHGSVTTWTSVTLTTSDIQTLTNSRWPVVTVANCLSGYFADKFTSVAEEFQRRPGAGAAAVWAPSSIGYPSDHRVLVEQFYDAMFQDNRRELGAVATTAKIEAYGLNNDLDMLVETYLLFGDPAQAVGIPPSQQTMDVEVFIPFVIK
jgi:hypothetical protein